MAETAQPQQSPVTASFVEHVRAFHHSLPEDERMLLEEIFALAESASSDKPDVQGFSLQWGAELLEKLSDKTFWSPVDPPMPR
ncbi:MAG TPA: hypothetical protein VK821_05685 [Dehalococcoidia bacterium]|nr:hypothetical protein [Dehalococcoidia bacterium]